MEWQTVEISKTRKGRGCFASVRDGMIKFSAEASLLIDNYQEYKYALLLKSSDKKNKYVGIKLIKEQADNCVAVLQTKYKGNPVNGIKVNCKPVVNELFGAVDDPKKTVRYEVTKDPDDNILVINLHLLQ